GRAHARHERRRQLLRDPQDEADGAHRADDRLQRADRQQGAGKWGRSPAQQAVRCRGDAEARRNRALASSTCWGAVSPNLRDGWKRFCFSLTADPGRPPGSVLGDEVARRKMVCSYLTERELAKIDVGSRLVLEREGPLQDPLAAQDQLARFREQYSGLGQI